MGEPISKASDPERRASVRTSTRLSLQQTVSTPLPELEDLDDDDYSLLALGGMVSDGFRPQPANAQPTAAAAAASIGNVEYEQPATRSVSPDLSDLSAAMFASTATSSATPPSTTASSSPTIARLNRSSISKPPRDRDRDSLTLRHDGGNDNVAGSSLSRVSSVSSEAAYVTPDTPYQGPTAPSHAYQIYAQDTRLARTMSVATTSTTPTGRPESEYNGPRGPSHPYSMYPQNPVEESNPQPAVPAIPVGFTHAPDPYLRRIGPEGEELADIIGPDGHTEELPPYTRYPDEFYARKIRANENSQPAGEGSGGAGPAALVVATTGATAAAAAIPGGLPVTTLANVPPTIYGAGGIGLAARNPEFDSHSVDDAVSPQSRQSTRSFANESHHEINTAAAAVSEKPQLNKYQRFARKKACGVVPYWALGLTFTAILIVLIVVAAVIGSLISHHKKPSAPTPTNYQDSMPSMTVTFDATPIPTPDNLQELASGSFGIPLNINQAPNTCFNNTAQTSAWSCNIAFQQAMSLQLTITRNAPQLGRDGTYDVLLAPNASFPPPPADGAFTNPPLAYGASVPVIQPAMNMELVNDTFDLDRGPAWFRMVPYNKTVLVQEDLLTIPSTSSRKGRRDGAIVPTVSNFQRKGVAQEGERPWLCTWPDTFVEIFIYAQQNSSYASQSTATITTAPPLTASATSTASGATATSTDATEVINMERLTAYPRAIKVKERRVSQSPRPYCVQMVVNADNTTTPITDASGNQIVLEIDEIEESNGMNKRDTGDEVLLARGSDDGDMSDCGCMWISS